MFNKITLKERAERLRRTLGITAKQAEVAAREEERVERLKAVKPVHVYTIKRANDRDVLVVLEGELKQSSVDAMREHIERCEREFTGHLKNAK